MQSFQRRRSSLIILFLFFAIFFSLRFSAPSKTAAEKVKDIYVASLVNIQQEIKKITIASTEKRSLQELQHSFYQCRLAYKKISFLVEYFNPFETRFLNGPALARTEDDNPQVIIDPRGFQVLEEILFKNWEKKNYELVIAEAAHLSKMITRLQEEPDFQYKFHDEPIFGAFRTALIRVAAMDITGFDSPVAAHSLPETVATLDGLRYCIDQYSDLRNKKNDSLFQSLLRQLTAARDYVTAGSSFEKFDRLVFLRSYLDPLFSTLTHARDALGISFSTGLLPVNQRSASIFDTSFFNIDFFSPNDRYRVTRERVELGKLLFFDPVLSGNKKRSCGSCHEPSKAFADGIATPLDIDGTKALSRNTPTLLNSVYQTKQFYDSRTATLENQLSDVVHNSKEMRGSLQDNIPGLKKDNRYSSLFTKAYFNDKEPITQYNIANAIASYIRSLVMLESRFDLYMRGDESQLNTTEKNGFNLFAGKAKCATCHFIPLFNGLVPPTFNETESEVLGVPKTRKKHPALLDDDLGKYLFTRSEVHKHSFKTPTLRNIELTAPYMHNGVFQTLEQVMEFYNKGGGKGLKIAPSNQTLPFDKLDLSKKEIKDIIAFMKTLTDTTSRYY